MVPVVFAVSETLNTNPLYLALGNRKFYDLNKICLCGLKGVTITASYAFMLPVGTPYNAIVYDAGQVNIDFCTHSYTLNIVIS